MGGFSNVLAGWAQAAHEHNVNLLQMEYENRQKAGDVYAKFAENQNLAPEQRNFLLQGALAHYNFAEPVPPKYKFDPEKPEIKIPVTVPATQGPPQEQPGGVPPGSPGAPPMGNITPSLAGAPNVPPPIPGPGMTQTVQRSPLQPYTPEEQATIDRQLALAKGAPAITDTLLKSAMGTKQGTYVNVDEKTGQPYQMIRYRGVDPSSFDVNDMSKLRWREWEEKSDLPVRPFAPRAVVGGALSVEDVMNAVANDVPLQFDHKPTEAEVAKVTAIMPNAQLIPTGPNQWYVAAQHWNKSVGANGHLLLYPGTPSTGAEPFAKVVDTGIANSALPKNTGTATQPSGVDPETGLRTPSITNRTQTVTIPGNGATPPPGPRFITTPPGAPTPPPGPQNAAPPATVQPAAPTNGTVPAPTQPLMFGPQGAKPAIPNAGPSVTPKQFEDAEKAGTGMRGIAQAISGDTASLEQYAPLAANPQLRGQMATVFQTLQDTLNAHGNDPNFNVALGVHFGVGGNLAKILGDVSGINQAAVQTEVNRIQNVLTQGITAGGSPEINRKAQNAVSAVMALFAVLPAMRNISGNPVYRASMNRLELEIPTFFNVGSAQDVYQKLGLISRELAVAGTNKDLQRYLGKGEVQQWAAMRDRFESMANMSNDELYNILTNKPNAPK